MAKFVQEKKKRIAHNKTLLNEDHEMLPEDVDIVSSIMQTMNNSVSTDVFKTDFVELSKTLNAKKGKSAGIQNTAHASAPNFKKFGISRTFPLMQKCQKDLKQLKHNRKIPKPRAHLAGLSNQTPHNENSLPPAEKTKKVKVIKKPPSTVIDKPVHRGLTLSETKMRKHFVDKSKSKKVSQRLEPQIRKRNSSVEEASDVENNSLKKSCNNSSDSEYEKFIQKQKKELQKEYTNQKKNIKNPKSQSLTKTKKRVLKNISTESDSDSCDEAAKPYHKNKKRLKKNHKVLNKKQSRVSTEEHSESESNIYDETFHDSGSETAADVQSENNPCNSSALGQIDKPAPEIKSPLKPSIDSSLMDIDHPNTLYKTFDSTRVVDPGQSVGLQDESFGVCSVSKQDNINDSTQEDSSKLVVIDLTESDNEENTTLMPKIVTVSSQDKSDSILHSEESDLEVVDVIIYPEKTDAKNIKTEVVDQTPSCSNTKPESTFKSKAEMQIPVNCKYEVVYTTDICKQYDEGMKSKDNMKFDFNDDIVQRSIPSNSEESFVLNKVKEEPCDDCEVVLDTVSTSNLTKNLSNVQTCSNTSVKTEKDSIRIGTAVNVASDIPTVKHDKLTQKEQKVHEVACSNLRNLATICNKSLGSLEEGTAESTTENLTTSLQILKNEFSTYQEILNTVQYVQTSFKLLERRQAEKLLSIKHQITKLLEGLSGDNSDAIKNAINKLKCSIKVPSVSSETITDEDLKTFAVMNLVPLSSIPESDIKPNLSELQSALKQEPSSSDEINTMSFGEKCIVCANDASAACQQCAKVFFCSNECGKKYWEDGHKEICAK